MPDAVKKSTKDIILERMQQSGDFPALSNTINTVTKFTSSTSETSLTELSNAILNDYSLTSKVLKVVNSVAYRHFGEVSTISRAVIVLGFENIKDLALAITLFEHLDKHKGTNELKDLIIKSIYSGILARQIAGEIETAGIEKEEAFICALFHTFGKLLACFYLPEKVREINDYMLQEGVTEDAAARAVLDETYPQIGMSLAKGWNFPDKIVYSMDRLSASDADGKLNEIQKLQMLSTVSNEISNILGASSEKEEKEKHIEKLIKSFNRNLHLKQKRINSMIKATSAEIVEYTSVFNILLTKSPFAKELGSFSYIEKPEKEPQEKESATSSYAEKPGEKALTEVPAVKEPAGTPVSGEEAFLTSSEAMKMFEDIFEPEAEETPEKILSKGIQEVNSTLLSNYSLNDIISIVLETMYRGMRLSGESIVLFFIRDTVTPAMNIRLGFGSAIEELKKWFKIPLGGTSDLFNLTFLKKRDIVIKNLDTQEMRPLLPLWYRQRVSGGVFVILLPIFINDKLIGLFYAEGEKSGMDIVSEQNLNYLKILRDQVTLAIKQKQRS